SRENTRSSCTPGRLRLVPAAARLALTSSFAAVWSRPERRQEPEPQPPTSAERRKAAKSPRIRAGSEKAPRDRLPEPSAARVLARERNRKLKTPRTKLLSGLPTTRLRPGFPHQFGP